MANQDRVNFVWAESALTTIPPIPVSEVAYRDTTQTPEQMEVGQQYDTIYNSARHNQLLFLLTSVAKTLCENGIMPFLAGQEYSQYARCIFTDGKLYTASRAILANEQPYPTPGDDSGVWIVEKTTEHLVPDSRRVIAGKGLKGGGPLSADVTLTAKLTDSVSSTDSTTAASATAVKTAYNLAKGKQANLGFTPVQQGGGTGQGSDKIYIGYSKSGLKAQAKTLDLGNVVTTSAGCTKAPSAALADNATNAQNLVVTPDGQTAKFNWDGRYTGQPEWVWGGNAAEFGNMYTWNPSNFRVSYANSAGSAATANKATGLTYTFTTNSSLVLPPGGTWFVLNWWDGDAGAARGNWSGGQIVAGGSSVGVNNGAFALRVA